jgi:hypothetical protein
MKKSCGPLLVTGECALPSADTDASCVTFFRPFLFGLNLNIKTGTGQGAGAGRCDGGGGGNAWADRYRQRAGHGRFRLGKLLPPSLPPILSLSCPLFLSACKFSRSLPPSLPLSLPLSLPF